MDFKYILFVLMFLLIIPIVYASEIKVLYFFGSSCEFSQIEEANINKIKSYWEGKVDWHDYDLDNKFNLYMTNKYEITGVPVAVVECLNKTIKIDRKDSYFSQKINQTINQCQPGGITKETKINNVAMFLVLVFFVCLAAIYLAKKYLGKKHLKRRLKKKKRKTK